MRDRNRNSGKLNSRKLNRRRVPRLTALLTTGALLILFSFATYLVYAKYVHTTDEETNELTESYVSCSGTEEITEVTEEVNSETVTKTHKTSVTIENTGNVASYIRVCLVSYWEDSSGYIVARNSVTPVGTALSALASGETAASATTDTTFVLSDDWIVVAVSDANGEYDYYYYYTKPVEAGASTPNLLADGSYITLVTEDGYIQVIEILAEAIQAEPTTAVIDAWDGVKIAADGSTLEAE